MKKIGWLALAAVICFAVDGFAVQRFKNTSPKGVYLGLGLGIGSAKLSENGAGQQFDSKIAFAGSVRVGFIIEPNLLIGSENTLGMFGIDGESWVASLSAISFTYYPYERVFFKAGPAAGSIKRSREASGSWRSVSEASGLGVRLAAGLDVSTSDKFSILPMLQFDHLFLDPEPYRQFSLLIEVGWFW